MDSYIEKLRFIFRAEGRDGAFFSGDRPGDLGQVKVPEILCFPTNDGFLFDHVWEKL